MRQGTGIERMADPTIRAASDQLVILLDQNRFGNILANAEEDPPQKRKA